jgi:hypothetical protein
MSGAMREIPLIYTFAPRLAGWIGAVAVVLGAHAATAAEIATESALGAGNQGLFVSADFRLVKGDCADCATLPQARWYFGKDLIAVPRPGVEIAGMTRGIAPQEDVRRWYASTAGKDPARPPLVWIGAPELVVDARLEPGGERLKLKNGGEMGFKLTAKMPENRSYYDSRTAAYFARRPLRIRGHVEQAADGAPVFVARTIWPQDYVLDAAKTKLAPLGPGESLDALVRREVKGERDTYEARLLWERNPGQPRGWDKLAALGVLLNGAQGDDDEAHGGHFAIVTGRVGPGGQWSDWMVNNFYNLDSFSEKGIVAAMVPMDNYQMDLNSGQSYYRPSYLLVALLKNDRAAHAYQGAIQRVYNRFYRHDFLYDHAAANCAGISIDTLRSIGWRVPERGPTSYLKAVAAYPYMAIKDMSLASGQKSFAYLKEERTRLYPAVTFDAIGNDLLGLVGAAPVQQRSVNTFEKMLQDDVEAVIFVRIPQLPSSRKYGTFPVASIDEYLKRVPEDKSKWEIVPVDPRPFPKEFADGEALQERVDYTSVGVSGILLLAGVLLAAGLRRRGRAS